MMQLSLLQFGHLHRPNPSDVAALADGIIAELDLTPPIDPKIVASYLDVSKIEQADIDVAGCLVCDGNDITIKVRQGDATGRQRFTIFHECSHTFFQGFERQPQYRCAPSTTPGQDSNLEALCDHGASALLLPRSFVEADLLQADFGIPTLMEMADTYQASLEATGHRVVDLAPYPTLFVVLKRALKPAERNDPLALPKLRVQSARGRGHWPYIPTHKSVGTDSPLNQATLDDMVHDFTTLDDLCSEPFGPVEVSACLAPHRTQHRVLALFRYNRI